MEDKKKNYGAEICALVFVGVIVIGGIIIGIGESYNEIVHKNQAADTAWANIQDVYQRRFDLIPNVVSTVQGAANFEKSTLVEIARARASAGQVKLGPGTSSFTAADLEKFGQAQDGLSSALSRLLVVVEKYPELKANKNFLALQEELAGTENNISANRKKFNDAVRSYNVIIAEFPTCILAKMGGFKSRPYFQAVADAERAPVVKF